MTRYALLVFVHVLGAVGIFAALAVEAVSLGRLRRADKPADVCVWTSGLALPRRLGPVAMMTTLASGIWMMAVAWGHQPWLVDALIGLVAMAAAGVVTLRRGRQLRLALVTETASELSDTFQSVQSGHGAALTASLRLRIAIGIGILALMTVKPDATGSWIVLSTMAAAGLIAGIAPLAALRRRHGFQQHPSRGVCSVHCSRRSRRPCGRVAPLT